MKRLYYWLYIISLSLRWVFRINLGDWVYYREKMYKVNNGVPHNMWKLLGLQDWNGGYVYRKDCEKVWSLKNCIGSFKRGYSFYMLSWYDIWVRVGIKRWMRGCNIW